MAPKVIKLAYKNEWIPFMREVSQIEDIIPMLNGIVPPMPPMPLVLPFWNPFASMQKSPIESSMEQVQKFFEYLMDTINSFLKSLPGFPTCQGSSGDDGEEENDEGSAEAEPAEKKTAKKRGRKKKAA